MKFDKNKSPPPCELGWISVRQLDREGMVGGGHAIKVKLEQLREELIKTFVDKGASEGDAVARVDRDFVGERVRPSGGGKGLYASPEAIAMLELKSSLARAAKSWKSANQLSLEGTLGLNPSRVATKLRNLRDEFVCDYVGVGLSQDEAIAIVDGNLIGRRRTGLGSQEALFASPEALRMLDRRGDEPADDSSSQRGR